MKRPAPKIIEMNPAEFEELMRRAEQGAFEEGDYAKIRGVLEAYLYVLELVDQKSTSIARLRKLLFGATTEKTKDVVGRETSSPAPNGDQSNGEAGAADAPASTPVGEQKPKQPGHGRNGADDYPGATRVEVHHESLKPGNACPDCLRGKVYEMAERGVLIRLIGQPPVAATIYELQKLRCNLCGKVFTAEPPAEAGAKKYDASAVSIIAMLRYGLGFPWNRLDRMQKDLEIPLPASTQWEIVSAAAPQAKPVYEELIRQAAQGELLHHDDTTVKILEFMGKRAKEKIFHESGGGEEGGQRDPPERTGLFTSGVVAISGGLRIALFISGRQHAGENLVQVLRRRATDLPPPIQMCDALSRNMPSELRTIIANCLAHGRRQFVEVNERFPAECRYVLEALEKVYRNDALARKDNLSAEERLTFHQTQSGPVMEELRDWLNRQFDERLVEPNSGLGAAINYLRKHWEKLTLFLRVAGAPLDNNICERALKKAIMHRKNSLFYKTQNGAAVGDLYMSLIHTCELNDVNPFDYLNELQRHADEVAKAPAAWLPWNYHEQLAAAAAA
ncbi:MAG TPA: transposase [Terriglobia bacterium]|nr:transposase [Terriglobia bacterium]